MGGGGAWQAGRGVWEPRIRQYSKEVCCVLGPGFAQLTVFPALSGADGGCVLLQGARGDSRCVDVPPPPAAYPSRPTLEKAHHTWMGGELGATQGTAWCDRQPQGLPGSAGSQNPSGLTASRGQWGPVGRKPERPGLCVLILRASLTALPTTPEQSAALLFQVP